jgi:hypothetical protein
MFAAETSLKMTTCMIKKEIGTIKMHLSKIDYKDMAWAEGDKHQVSSIESNTI